MIEKFEHKGVWFLPHNSSRKVHGILKYDYENNLCVLELIGSFYDFSNYDGEDIILGVTTNGDKLTLSDCHFSSSSGIARDETKKPINWNDDRSSTLNFRVTSIFKGLHVFRKEDLVFQRIYVEIFNLDEWIGITGLSTENDYPNEIKIISYKKPESIHINIDEDIDMEIKFNTNHPIRFRFTKELLLKQKTILSFHSKKYKTLAEFIYLLRKFTYFLSTSLQKPVRIQSIELYCDKFKELIRNNEHEIAIDAFQIINPELKFEMLKHDWQMLFTYNEIKDQFEVIMKKWFQNYDKFEAPFNLVLSQYYVSQYFLENLFINVAQAAESFHRRLEITEDNAKHQQDLEFENKVNRIVESAPEDLKNWVKSQISKPPKHFYETRLTYLFENFSNSELDIMIGNRTEFIKKVSFSRNYYTHLNSDLKEKAAHGYELADLYEKLRLLLLCSFLIESGFDKITLEDLIKEKSNNVFGYLKD